MFPVTVGLKVPPEPNVIFEVPALKLRFVEFINKAIKDSVLDPRLIVLTFELLELKEVAVTL